MLVKLIFFSTSSLHTLKNPHSNIISNRPESIEMLIKGSLIYVLRFLYITVPTLTRAASQWEVKAIDVTFLTDLSQDRSKTGRVYPVRRDTFPLCVVIQIRVKRCRNKGIKSVILTDKLALLTLGINNILFSSLFPLCCCVLLHAKPTHISCSPSTHSLVSGNLNAGVSYTGKTPMLKRPEHAQPYHATKNSST